MAVSNLKADALALRVLEIARQELGQQEDPKIPNWGDAPQKYLKSVGINFPASWCMAFSYWCVNEASKSLGLFNPLIRTGGVLDQWNKVPSARKKKLPNIGSIFIMDFGRGLGHTGIVTEIIGDKIKTIEGNSNDEGSREGYEVCERTREISKCKGFINIS
jgi:hypothetical protein